jgi:transcriptional/translational regulatory protein YebC/TACO1
VLEAKENPDDKARLLTMVPVNTVKVEKKRCRKSAQLVDALKTMMSVQNVYAKFDSEYVLAKWKTKCDNGR